MKKSVFAKAQHCSTSCNGKEQSNYKNACDVGRVQTQLNSHIKYHMRAKKDDGQQWEVGKEEREGKRKRNRLTTNDISVLSDLVCVQLNMYEQKCQYLRERLPPLAPAGIEPATVVVGKWELVRSSDFISTFSFTSPKPKRKFGKGLGYI